MKMLRRLFPAAVLLVGIVLVTGCNDSNNNGGGGGGTPNSTISIVPSAFNKGMLAFTPASDTVHVGNVVRMHNGDSITHNIQPDAGGFPSWGSLPANTNVDVTANAAGTFGYHCVIASHTMSGQLVVLP